MWFIKYNFYISGISSNTSSITRIPPITKRNPFRNPANRGGTSENSKTHRPDTTPAHRHLRRLQEGTRMRHMHGRVPRRRLPEISTLHAHLPHVLHRRLAHEESHLSQLHGTGGRGIADELRNQLSFIYRPVPCKQIN